MDFQSKAGRLNRALWINEQKARERLDPDRMLVKHGPQAVCTMDGYIGPWCTLNRFHDVTAHDSILHSPLIGSQPTALFSESAVWQQGRRWQQFKVSAWRYCSPSCGFLYYLQKYPTTGTSRMWASPTAWLPRTCCSSLKLHQEQTALASARKKRSAKVSPSFRVPPGPPGALVAAMAPFGLHCWMYNGCLLAEPGHTGGCIQRVRDSVSHWL